MKDQNYKPSGELQGDSAPMPNQGTGTAVVDSYEADLSADATNRMGSIAGASKSDKGEA